MRAMRHVRIFTAKQLAVDTRVELSGTAARHISQVLRMASGEVLVLFDGSGREYPGVIQSAAKNRVVVELTAAREPAVESPLRITLWHGLCRGSRMDTVVQKATELGVAHIQPVIAEHSVVRLDAARASKKTAHWNAIAASACEQSGRVVPPIITNPRELLACLDDFRNSSPLNVTAVMCDPDGSSGLSQSLVRGRETIIITGPEGGFSPAEKDAAVTAGFQLVSLGPRILRTETAPVAALSIAQAIAGDLGQDQ
jgi:16S rRNA (uracil1498-N3)-methyltransferase